MLWLLDGVDQISYDAVSCLLPTLSPRRAEAVCSLRSREARVQRILAELLLRRAVLQEFGLSALPALQTGEKGKPFFPDFPALQFNLSHCKNAVACALDTAPLGVDVQELRRLHRGSGGKEPSLYRILSPREREWVTEAGSDAERDARFLTVWTCKEAYGKALGCGYLYDLKSTEFLPNPETWRQYGFFFSCGILSDAVWTLCAQTGLPTVTLTASDFLAEAISEYSESR